MLISLNWLQQYLPTIDQVDAEEVAERLSHSLAEVEQIIELGKNVSNIVIGEITEVEPHPKSEDIQICKVKIGVDDIKQIVHGGGKKVKVGDKVPVCLPGGSVINPVIEKGQEKIPLNQRKGFTVIEKEINGVNSQGMICSLRELGLVDEHKEVMILHPNSKTGEKLDPVLKDKILEIENKSLTHRPDCFSHLGIAREIAALYNLKIERKADLSKTFLESSTLELKVEQKAQEKCPRFTAIAIKDVEIGPAPFWMQAALAQTGVRPVNNLVDISNYLMLDIGQPTHIFDYDKLEGHKIVIRHAKDKEEVITIDGKKRTLTKDMAVLADSKKVIGLPGIMGSKDSEVSSDTKNIALVVENWEMYALRRTSRDLGLRTEASTRFEKGLDPTNLTDILRIEADMITDLSNSEIASEIIDIYPEPEKPVTFEFDLNSVFKILGIELTKEEIISILESLGINVLGDEKIEENVLARADDTNKINLEIPSFRRDLKIKEDIIEEIARIHGYQTLPPTIPSKPLTPIITNPLRYRIRKIKDLLSKYGIDEIYSYSMIGEELAGKTDLEVKDLIKIKNPLSPELGYIRNSLITSLIDKVELNVKNRFDDFAIYEISRVAYKNKKNKDLPAQPYHLAIAVYSRTNPVYEILKGYLDALIEDLQIPDIQINPEKKGMLGLNTSLVIHTAEDIHLPKAWHPAQSGDIELNSKKNKTKIGIIGNAHPKIYRNFKFEGHLSLLEIQLDQLFDLIVKEVNKYAPVSNQPAVYRDLSFWIKKDLHIGQILTDLQNMSITNLEKVNLTDIYKDKKHDNRTSITLNIVLRAKDKTLGTSEAEDSIKLIIEHFEKNYSAQLRK